MAPNYEATTTMQKISILAAAAVVELDEAAAAAAYLRGQIGAGDVVLIKGSRGVHLDRIIPALEAEGEA